MESGLFEGLEDLRGEALERELAGSASHIDAAFARQLVLIRVFDEAGEWAHYGARSCVHFLDWRLGMSPVIARERVRIARALGELPRTLEALASGELSYSKVRAITRVARPDNEETLLDFARKTTAAHLETICRCYRQEQRDGERKPPERKVTWRPLGDGMVHVGATLMADEAEIVWESLQDAARKAGQEAAEASAAEQEKTQGFCENDVSAETPDTDAELPDPYLDPAKALEHERELREEKPDAFERSGKARLPDALVWLCEKSLAGRLDTSKGAEMYQILIHLERDALEPNGFKAQLADGTALSPDAFRRIACDASLVPALVDERGNVLDIGRKTRTIPPAIRRALDMRDRKCCFPGCNNRRWLHAHHIEAWAHGGDTKLDNLCLLCTYHHQLVHERGYGLRRLEDGEVAFYYPSGVRIARHPARRPAPTDPHRELVAMQSDVMPRDAPAWDGNTPDFDACVGALM